jgi:hypothetical protein
LASFFTARYFPGAPAVLALGNSGTGGWSDCQSPNKASIWVFIRAASKSPSIASVVFLGKK